MPSDQQHWREVYEQRAPDQLSWFEAIPERSLALIEATDLGREAEILDAGGGASGLAGELLKAGYSDVTVADLSVAALEQAQADLAERSDEIHLGPRRRT